MVRAPKTLAGCVSTVFLFSACGTITSADSPSSEKEPTSPENSAAANDPVSYVPPDSSSDECFVPKTPPREGGPIRFTPEDVEKFLSDYYFAADRKDWATTYSLLVGTQRLDSKDYPSGKPSYEEWVAVQEKLAERHKPTDAPLSYVCARLAERPSLASGFAKLRVGLRYADGTEDMQETYIDTCCPPDERLIRTPTDEELALIRQQAPQKESSQRKSAAPATSNDRTVPTEQSIADRKSR